MGSTYPTRQLPELASARGVHARTHARTHAPTPSIHPDNYRISRIDNACTPSGIGGVFDALAQRLRDVRVTCGDWSRVLGPSVTVRLGVTAILLDPPYSNDEHDIRYSAGAGNMSADVRAWAITNGENGELRIALCGYEGEHEMPSTWECVPWKAQGGYGSTRKRGENMNACRERVWFSPSCQRASLFSDIA
jgi:hypothetical protein